MAQSPCIAEISKNCAPPLGSESALREGEVARLIRRLRQNNEALAQLQLALSGDLFPARDAVG